MSISRTRVGFFTVKLETCFLFFSFFLFEIERKNWKRADRSKSDNVEIILYLREDVSYVYTNNGMEMKFSYRRLRKTVFLFSFFFF